MNTETAEAMSDTDSLMTCWEKLGARERKIVLVYMYRLWAGQRKYGPISEDKKDWTYEALEEVLDACVYLSAALKDSSDKAFKAMLPDAVKEITEAEGYQPSNVSYDPKDAPEVVNPALEAEMRIRNMLPTAYGDSGVWAAPSVDPLVD